MAISVGTYSFQDVVVTISGPGGSFPLGNTSAPAEEGITIEKEPKNTKTNGADGSVMHSMHATEAGKIIIRLLKTSPVNAQLSALYNFQGSSSINWGQNVFSLRELVTGDVYTIGGAAFTKFPNNTYATVGNTIEWEFEAALVTPFLGVGQPVIL